MSKVEQKLWDETLERIKFGIHALICGELWQHWPNDVEALHDDVIYELQLFGHPNADDIETANGD